LDEHDGGVGGGDGGGNEVQEGGRDIGAVLRDADDVVEGFGVW